MAIGVRFALGASWPAGFCFGLDGRPAAGSRTRKLACGVRPQQAVASMIAFATASAARLGFAPTLKRTLAIVPQCSNPPALLPMIVMAYPWYSRMMHRSLPTMRNALFSASCLMRSSSSVRSSRRRISQRPATMTSLMSGDLAA